MPDRPDIDKTLLQDWSDRSMTPEAVKEALLRNGLDETAVAGYLREFRKLRNAKKQFTGFACLAAGAMLGFISLVLSLTNPIPGMLNIFMFGLTSLAILVVFIGLYLLFE